MAHDLIAALDVGKTHTRVSTLDPYTGKEQWSAKFATQTLDTPLGRQLPIASIERWLAQALKDAPRRKSIRAVVPIAHGAAAVLLDAEGQVLAAPDYEDPRFESVNQAYDAERDPFDQTFSPGLPLGLNLGRQLFCLERQEPQLFARVAHIVPFAQFWAWRLSGVLASEVTSLGCHSDLWLPASQQFSELARRRGWAARIPARRFAADVLGPARGPLAEAAGLSADCRIVCGIHDSNASYLRHLLSRRDQPFAVVSSGTWTVVMANQAPLAGLDPQRDMLANVDVFGSPVATARFMGGREYEAIAQTQSLPTPEALHNVVDRGALALPAFARGGPFAASQGQLLRAVGLSAPERAALATLYVALMCDLVLDSLPAKGDVIIDGPLAANPLFGSVLAALRPRSRVMVYDRRSPLSAICFLAGFAREGDPPLDIVDPVKVERLDPYKATWRDEIRSPAP